MFCWRHSSYVFLNNCCFLYSRYFHCLCAAMFVLCAVSSCFSKALSVEYELPSSVGDDVTSMTNGGPSTSINYVWNRASCCDGGVDAPHGGYFGDELRLPLDGEFSSTRTTATGELFGISLLYLLDNRVRVLMKTTVLTFIRIWGSTKTTIITLLYFLFHCIFYLLQSIWRMKVVKYLR